MYDMNDLLSFRTLIETKNLTQAAKQLAVSKSTLSRRISHLESCMGQPLLLRQANKIFANDAGNAFYPYACRILEAAQQAQKKVDSLKDTVSGDLAITVYYGLIRSWLPKEIIEFADQYPDINISMKSASRFEELSRCRCRCLAGFSGGFSAERRNAWLSHLRLIRLKEVPKRACRLGRY